MDKEIEISPENTYVLALNNNSLAVFIDSPIEDMIHYPTFETCTKFCAVRHSSFSYLYINYFKKLNQKINIKVTAVVNSAQIISVKFDSPKISKIQPISTKVINLIQVTEKNYFYSDSYDNYAKIYLGEYNEEIQIADILNTNTDFFPESHGKVFELEPNKIYVLIASAKDSYIKSYLYNEIPENVKIANGNLTLLYLQKGKKYEFDFESNTLSFLIKLNPVKSSKLDIINDSGNKATLNSINKYYNPIGIDQVYKGEIRINNIQDDDALIEILYSFGQEETEVISERTVTNKTFSKKLL